MDSRRALAHEETSPYEVSSQPPSLEQRRSRRLSKPRTNGPGKALLKSNLSAGDLSLITTGSSFASVADVSVACPATEYKEPGQIQTTDTDLAESSSPTGMNDSKRDGKDTESYSAKAGRLQRAGTKVAKRLSVHRKAMSTAALSELVREEEFDSQEYEWIKKKAQEDEMVMRMYSSQPQSDAAHHTKAPIRRKSLLTPGLATRGGDLLRKPPSAQHTRSQTQPDIQLHYYNPYLSPTSPLAQLASLDVPAIGSRSSVDLSRAVTPAELDYGALGGLRITNGGAVSPAMSMAKGDRRMNQPARTIFASPQGTDSDGGWSQAETVSVAGASIGGDNEVPEDPIPSPDAYTQDIGNPWLATQDRSDEVPAGTASEPMSVVQSIAQLRRWPTVTSVYSQSEHGGEQNDRGFSQAPQHSTRRFAYTTTILSPVPDQGRSPSALQATSKVSEADALLFDDDEPLFPSPETIQDTFSDRAPSPIERPQHISQLAMSQVLDSILAASRFTPLPRTEQEMTDYMPAGRDASPERPPLSATDSGYGSSYSFGGRSKKVSPASSVSQGTVASDRSSRFSGPRPQPVKRTQIAVHKPNTSLASVQPLNNSQPPQLRLTPTKVPATVHAATELPKTPSKTPTSLPSSLVLTPSTKPEETARESSPTGKKLQKRPPRPKSMPPPVDRIVITGCTEPENSAAIPKIPQHIALRNAERGTSRPYDNKPPPSPVTALITAYASPTFDEHRFMNSGSPPPVPPKDKRRHRASRSELIEKIKHPWSPVPDRRARDSSPEWTNSWMNSRPPQSAREARPPPIITGSRPMAEPLRRPATATVASFAEASDSDEASIDWEQYRRAWATRRQDAGSARSHVPDLDSIAHGVQQHAPADTRSDGRQRYHHRRTRTAHAHPEQWADFAPSSIGLATTVPSFGRYDEPRPISPLRPHTRSHPHLAPRPGSERWEEPRSVSPDRLELRRFSPIDLNSRPRTSHHGGQEKPLTGGRYEGGFGFGYEPGKGISGSAGTRGAGNHGASRKGGRGNLAQGFGVDLSDVPVFIQY